MKSNSPLREDKVSDFLGINMSKRTDGSILDNLLTLNIESAASAPAPSPEVAWAPEAALSPLLSWMNKGGISSVSTLCMDESVHIGKLLDGTTSVGTDILPLQSRRIWLRTMLRVGVFPPTGGPTLIFPQYPPDREIREEVNPWIWCHLISSSKI